MDMEQEHETREWAREQPTGIAPSVALYGSDEPPARRRILRAGPLSLVLEGGDLRYIRLGDREVLRRVYVAVRDPNWGTIAPRYTKLRLEERPDGFDLSFDAENVGSGIDMAWHGEVHGAADGTITYAMDGEARATFRKNRIGFCILHPMTCAGARCTVRHVDGASEDGAFPSVIAPHQPFVEFDAIAHEVAPGVWAEVRLAGETFEMEDQRNWTDASFKTYSTPLQLPYPVEVIQGTRIAQQVTLSLPDAPRVSDTGADRDGTVRAAADDADTVNVTIEAEALFRLPDLGLGMAYHGRPLSAAAIARLRALRPRHLRAEIDLTSSAYDETLRQAVAQGQALGVPLEMVLFVSDDAERELEAMAGALRRHEVGVARWLVFHEDHPVTPAGRVDLARRLLGPYQPGAPVGGGTNAYFTQLNRGRPRAAAFDVICYSINPQVHAFDNASWAETLAAQAVTVESARRFCGAAPLAVGPVTLKPRFNPDATGPPPEPAPDELPPQVDPRQMSLFGAGWTLGSIAHLARGAADSVTYYETTGWRGVMEMDDGSPLPGRFRSFPGMVFPLYHVLADVGEWPGARVAASATSDPLRAESLVLRDGPRLRALLANLTGTPCTVRVAGLGGDTMRVRRLDEETFARATGACEAYRSNPGDVQHVADGALELRLAPYAVARLDGAAPYQPGQAPSSHQ